MATTKSPPLSPSRTKEGNALRHDFNLDGLEQREQEFIQHVRTAGLRKPREAALVDELLAVRKDRRQIFSALIGHVIRIQSLRQEQSAELEVQSAALREAKSAHQLEIKKLEEAHANELLHQTQRLHRKYEEKLRTIGTKLEEVANAKRKDERSAAQGIAKEMTEAAVQEAERRFGEKLQRYKEALRAVAEKEKDTESLANRNGELARAYLREAQSFKLQLEEQKALLTDLNAREKTNASMMDGMRRALQAEQMESGALRVELGRVRDQTQAELRRVSEAHSEELAQVEEKVKAALQKRENVIQHLRTDLRQVIAEKNSVEQILSDLKNGLSFGR
jgi:hypothetical protein